MQLITSIDGMDWHYQITIDNDIDQHWTDINLIYGSRSYPRPELVMPDEINNKAEIMKLCFDDFLRMNPKGKL